MALCLDRQWSKLYFYITIKPPAIPVKQSSDGRHWVASFAGTHDAQIPHDHFTYFLKAVKQHMTTLALRDEEIGIQHIQSLPEDICCKVIKKPCSEANKILDKLHKYQCSSEVFLWLPPQETISGMGWINTTDRGVDQVANEINRWV